MSEQNPRIDELNLRTLLRLLILMAVMYAVVAVAFFFVSSRIPEDSRTIAIILLAVGGGSVVLFIIRLLNCRLRIDENGVDVDNLLGAPTVLRWEEIRTAAIVHLRVGNARANPLILLATRPAAEVLTRNALLGGKTRHRPEELARFDLTPARRAAVEHYLHMSLAEYHL